jgi:hypothetical protein
MEDIYIGSIKITLQEVHFWEEGFGRDKFIKYLLSFKHDFRNFLKSLKVVFITNEKESKEVDLIPERFITDKDDKGSLCMEEEGGRIMDLKKGVDDKVIIRYSKGFLGLGDEETIMKVKIFLPGDSESFCCERDFNK